MQPQQSFSANNQDANVVCAQCGAPMPKEMRFCRSCGNRLGEGPAEYTETVRFPNGQTGPGARGTTPFYAAPLAQAGTTQVYCPRRRRVRGMTWVWIAVAFVFMTGGVSSVFRRARHAPGSGVFAPVSRSYFGVDGFKSADGGVTFNVVDAPDGPADKAGLVGGDIITSFDGQSPKTQDEMMDLLRKTPIGKTVDVVYVRDGQTKNTKLTTISESEYNELNQVFHNRPEGRGKFGFEISRTTRVANGVRMDHVDTNGPADLFGIKEGDIITEFDGVPIRTRDELLSRVYRAIPHSSVQVTVLRDGQTMKIPVTMGKN
jgi:membrane-associated protease RseP (regulator of RpoE activity)/ribosomal protein L40E